MSQLKYILGLWAISDQKNIAVTKVYGLACQKKRGDCHHLEGRLTAKNKSSFTIFEIKFTDFITKLILK